VNIDTNYEVTWSGAHNGKDDDLFDVRLRIPVKHILAPGSRATILATVLRAIPHEPRDAMSGKRIAAVTNLDPKTVYNALSTLTLQGRILNRVLKSNGNTRVHWAVRS
jgi:hypothetical protein